MSATAADEEQQPLLGSDAHPVDPASQSLSSRFRTALSSPRALTALEKALAALAVVFLLTTATGFGLFAGEAVKYGRLKHHREHPHPPPSAPTSTVTATRTSSTLHGPTPTSIPPAPPTNPDELCLTGACVQAAAGILAALDPSHDPCVDPYLFANGGWLASHPIPRGKGSYGAFEDIDARNKRVIRSVLDRTPKQEKDLEAADKRILETLRTFYGSCVDEEALEKAGSEPLLDVVAEVVSLWRGEQGVSASADEEDEDDTSFLLQLNGLEVDPSQHGKKKHGGHDGGRKKWDPKTARARLTSALAYLHSRGIPALFETFTDGDVGADPSTVVLWLSQAGLGLPSKGYYKDQSTLEFYEKNIADVLREVYKRRGETDMGGLAEQVVKLEKAIAKISLEVDELDQPVPTYNPHNASSLQSLFPSISFANYFASYTPRPRFPDPVIVTAPTYFGNLTSLLEHTAPDVLEAYFVVQTSQALAPLLSPKQPLHRTVLALKNRLKGIPADVSPPRDEHCLDVLLSSFGFSVGRYFVEEAFGGESKQYAEEVIRAVIQAFKDRLPGRAWLDDETRDKAREKVDAIRVKIGYPSSPNTTDPAALERYYAPNLPVKKGDFFGNALRAVVADERRKWVSVGRPKDRGAWDMVPSEVNAYFQPSDNEIVFPAGILQTPFFSVDWPEYLVFGSFGGIAGHELTHSLDQAGRQYDKDGKLVDWWGPDTNARFLERQRCFEKQYGNYSIIGADGKRHYVNSRFTGGEDGADAGGIAQAFAAWSARAARPEHSERNRLLPGLQHFTREQLFFVAQAQGWARAMTPAEAQRRIAVDPHSPARFRVIGPLSNSVEFAKAFGCKAGSPMNRGEERCELW
ncbi:hypothetical protein JCM10450v2_005019 [Rhodotorula kratochvilovae]